VRDDDANRYPDPCFPLSGPSDCPLPGTAALFDGPKSSLEDILERREAREKYISSLCHMYPQFSLIVLTFNIPGPVKTSRLFREIFQRTYRDLRISLDVNGFRVFRSFCLENDAGDEAYFVVGGDAHVLKRRAVDRENSPFGRLLDLDVYAGGKALRRIDLGLPDRRCFICEDDAKSCGRSRRHSLPELREAVRRIIVSEDLN
jgi:holo-ACP synthase